MAVFPRADPPPPHPRACVSERVHTRVRVRMIAPRPRQPFCYYALVLRW